MTHLMFRIFPTQSGIVVIMSRRMIRHHQKNDLVVIAALSKIFFAIVVVLAGLSANMTMTIAAEYIVEDRQTPALVPRERAPQTAPDPSQLASGALSFDGIVGDESTQSILQPIAEDADDDSSWSSGGASVSVIDDAATRQIDDLESEWVVSEDLYGQPICDDSSAWDWTNGLNTWGNACKQACDGANFLHCYKNFCAHCRPGCWIGRVDAVFMWRNAPYERALVQPSGGGTTVLDANQLESTMAAGPRIQLFHRIGCGSGIELGYLRAFNFRSQRPLTTPAGGAGYQPLNIFPATPINTFTDADINLGSGIQTFEVNSRTDMGHGNVQFICGLRWLEWRESFTMNTTAAGPNQYDYGSRTMNSLYGGQIGIDALLYSNNWLRVESVLKGGAYYNLAVGQNTYSDSATPGNNFDERTTDSPDLASFVGELGFTGVVPLTSCLDFRFGYLAYWLEGIAQPTRQLSKPVSTTGTPLVLTNGGTVVQGVTIGLEGRW